MTDSVIVTQTVQNVVITNQQPNVVISQVGAQGPAGASGAGFFTYTQNTPASTWTITHNLGGYPAATVLDTSGNNCEGTISYTNANTMVITFTSSFSGTAYLV